MLQKLRRFSFLGWVEKAGNKLPHPATLFALMALLAILFSWVAALLDWKAIHPATNEVIHPFNLLSKDGIHRILEDMVTNFTSFAPLGIVLVAMLGIGIAESSGLIGALIRLLVMKSPKRIITFVLVLAGVLSNTASDIGYVLLIPLAGAIFHSFGRHPIAGMAAAFAGVSGGFSANLLLGTIDPLLAGLSTEAAHIIDADYQVLPTANYYFMVISTIMIAGIGTWVTERMVVPRLGAYKGEVEAEAIQRLAPNERRGLKFALLFMAVFTGLILIGIIPENGLLRPEDGNLLHSPVLHAIIAFLFLGAGGMGVAYGFGCGAYKNDADVMNGMGDSLKGLAGYMVLVFFAAQFVAYFKWSNLGVILAVQGADVLAASQIGPIPLMILFILLAASINMLMGSASAKWAILAPVFIPMFMLLGYSPELSQAIYRIGDSVTNIVSPMMSFFALIIAYFQKYDRGAGIGTIIATMLPYSIAFFIGWTILLIIWFSLGIPLGPGAGLFYEMGN
ncbi:AbgT family transporter [Sunxiuqinia elliptica]|uniref:Aminobenzoyl-glutamate transport protein n=1 Tax=Sunxiuqinia elliptica TaxID=655355 RepID=A0A4R6GMH6_9BACT|nr:AbgT family transporter [Sunxiuqinia elliptica]TDN96296.1 aminobenzoyl-glutamate transport protein [Sunxiuqinia elliptica]TDO68007.1 aminobenzoyl-glutamate transport protein [Sunxiuqinia elliptica]